MSRLPTNFGDSNNWGAVLNDFLDSSYGFYRLNGPVAAGATSIVVDRTPGIISSGAGHYIIIDPFTTEAELRLVTGVSGDTLTIPALTYAHTSGDQVYFVATAAQGDLIPWSWWGGQGSGDPADASQNVTAFNRLMGPSGQIYAVTGSFARFGVFIDGHYYVNDQLKPERSLSMRGSSPLGSSILATNTGNTFPFDTTGSVAVIHPYRDGSPVLYESTGPSGRWFMSGFRVSGQNLSNSNGILSSPQQPDSTKDLRVDLCLGKYGMALQDVQYHDMQNIQFDQNAVGLYMWSCGYVRVRNMNVTGNGTAAVKLVDTTDTSFYGSLLESVATGGKIFDVSGGSSRLGFYDMYTSGFTGGTSGDFFYFNCPTANPEGVCNYIITNARCTQNSATINFVNDVQRGITFNTLGDTNRTLQFMFAQDSAYQYVLGGLGQLVLGGDLKHTGTKVGFNGSTPVAKPTVTGSRGANAALASLLTALASEGLITDSSSA